MSDRYFAVDELEVDVLEPRHEMAIQPPPVSTCEPSTCLQPTSGASAIHWPPPSTCTGPPVN